ncbi:MAG: DUF3450 family protein [Verrucomicrobiales bacterium]|nr:DUF3450 family protein [Verrucomicrobiales bacterium]
MRVHLGYILIALAHIPTAGRAAEGTLGPLRVGIEQWVQTKQLISRTKSDWDAEKEMLLQTKALYERELSGIDDQMSKVSTNSVQVDRDRAVLDAELKDSNATLDHARVLVAGLEAKASALAARMPDPLKETLQPLLNRLPQEAASSKTAVTERLQTVVSLFNEIDKFNNAISITSEKRKNDRGEEIAVESVYVGLGAAYFVNQTGDFAGTGEPGADGWRWSVNPSLAAEVREIIRIYRGERTASFVLLPVQVQ